MRNLFSVTIICLSFVIVGIFLSLSNNLQNTARELANNMVVTLFLDKGISSEEVAAIEQEIRGAPFVAGVEFISAASARSRFQSNFPELRSVLDNLTDNPFPPSLEANLKDNTSATREVQDFIRDMKNRPGVEDVRFNRDWVDKMQSLSRLAKAVGFFLGGILILASFFIISISHAISVSVVFKIASIAKFVVSSLTAMRNVRLSKH